MFTNIENLKIEDIYRGFSRKQATITCRKSTSLILRLSGCIHYDFKDFTLETHPGEIIFLPFGSTYNYRSATGEPCEYVSIRFSGDISGAAPSVHSINNFHDAEELVNSLTELWKFGGQAEHYKCYSVFYSLLSYLENLEKLSYIDKKKFNIISPAVLYLKKHIYDCDLKIETLNQLCGISGTYFNKIFSSNYSMSPQKYIAGKRLLHAKNLIDSGDFDTISEVALSVGYNDPLYFSRAFKKKYGVSPSKYAKG